MSSESNDSLDICVTEYILSSHFYLNNDFSIKKHCANPGISTDDFLSVVLTNLGTTDIKRIAMELRIEDAKKFICKNYSIRKIAKLTGFNNSIVYLYYFVKITSTLPSIWKKRWVYNIDV